MFYSHLVVGIYIQVLAKVLFFWSPCYRCFKSTARWPPAIRRGRPSYRYCAYINNIVFHMFTTEHSPFQNAPYRNVRESQRSGRDKNQYTPQSQLRLRTNYQLPYYHIPNENQLHVRQQWVESCAPCWLVSIRFANDILCPGCGYKGLRHSHLLIETCTPLPFW